MPNATLGKSSTIAFLTALAVAVLSCFGRSPLWGVFTEAIDGFPRLLAREQELLRPPMYCSLLFAALSVVHPGFPEMNCSHVVELRSRSSSAMDVRFTIQSCRQRAGSFDGSKPKLLLRTRP